MSPSTTRRGLLTVAGATLLAGCSRLDSSDDEFEKVYPGDLREIASTDENTPVVADSRPVEIDEARLAASAQRVSELVDGLPIPFGPEHLPNGHIRRRLTNAATNATDHISAARTAGSRLFALERLRMARADARYAAAGWAFVDRGLTEATLQADHRAIVSEAQSTRENIAYLGADPVDAALVYGLTEQYLDSALRNRRQPGRGESSQLLTVAEWGDRVELARAHVDDGQYLYDQFQSSLPDSATSVEQSLTDAVDTLTDELWSGGDDLPPEPTEMDDDNQHLWQLRHDLRDAAAGGVERVTSSPGPASSLLAATRGLTDQLAYDRLRTRIDDGEAFGATEAADVLDGRTAAVEAIRTALEETSRPALARPILADTARSVSFADERIADYDGAVRLGRLDHELFDYTAATLRARSVPAACQQTLNALDR